MDYCGLEHASPSGARFCGVCGRPTVVWECANGHRVDADRAFCDECGIGRPPAPGSAPPPAGAAAPPPAGTEAFAPEPAPPVPGAAPSWAVPPPGTPPLTPPTAPAGAPDDRERASPALITGVVVLGIIAVLVVLGTLARLAFDRAGDVAADDDEPVEELTGATHVTWDPGFKRRGIAICMDTSGLPADQARRECTCIFSHLEEELTYEEAVAMDERIARDPSYVPTEIRDAADQCA